MKIDLDNPLSSKMLSEIFKLDSHGKYIFHRESKNLEFKENFNHSGWSSYLKNFNAFANNNGGYIVFGVKDKPKEPNGLSKKSAQMFDEIDEEFISGEINKLFSPAINWEKQLIEVYGKPFGIIYIYEATIKPIISKQDEGEIKNGEIYYRYAGRTQKIEYGELNEIIENRIKQNTDEFTSLINKISKIGASNAAIMDTEKGVIEKDKDNILVLDETLIPKIKFIREGEFSERKGATALKLVGEVQPIDQVEIIKIKKENIIEQYPYTYSEMIEKIKSALPKVKQGEINSIISSNNLKKDIKYSAYNFRSKKHEQTYKDTGVIPKATPSLYNQKAIDFIIKVLQEENEL